MTRPRFSLPLRAAMIGIAARLRPRTDRLAALTARQPQVRIVVGTWHRLLDEACSLAAPVLSRFVLDSRLIAVPQRTGGLDFFLVKGGLVTSMGVPPTDPRLRGRLELRLRADQTIEHILTLPAASRDYLETIIDHRVERLVPWRREAALHGYGVVEHGVAGASLVVRVLLTSSDVVARPVAELRGLGLAPVVIGGDADRLAEPLRIALGRGTSTLKPPWHGKLGRSWLAGMASLCILAMASMITASVAEGRRVEAERHLVKARRLIREATDSALPENVPLLADKKPEKAVMVLINKLAAAIPDTGYLRELGLTPDEVRLVGTAADAPALIPLIEKAGFYNVRFTGPVSRGEDKLDSFDITADRSPTKDPR